MQNGRYRRLGALMLAGVMTFGLLLGGCGKERALHNPGNPVSLTVWHYYNGPQMAAFDALVEDCVAYDMASAYERSTADADT